MGNRFHRALSIYDIADIHPYFSHKSTVLRLLPSRLYCRLWNCTTSACARGLSPPVGNYTLPRRLILSKHQHPQANKPTDRSKLHQSPSTRSEVNPYWVSLVNLSTNILYDTKKDLLMQAPIPAFELLLTSICIDFQEVLLPKKTHPQEANRTTKKQSILVYQSHTDRPYLILQMLAGARPRTQPYRQHWKH